MATTNNNASAVKSVAVPKSAAATATKLTAKPAAKPAAKVAVKAAAKAPLKAKSKVPAQAPKAPVARPVAQATAKATVVTAKHGKVKKPKMVRDSLTIPKLEYAVLDALKLRAAKLASPVKKTELIRAGIKAIAAMPDAAFLAAIRAVPSLKTGRPAKSKSA